MPYDVEILGAIKVLWNIDLKFTLKHFMIDIGL